MKFRTIALAAAGLSFLVGAGMAQAPEKKAPEKKAAEKKAPEKKAGPPKPGPEVKKLDYFVGKWTSEGEIKPNPMMPAGKFSSSDSCSWFKGGFHVVCTSKGSGAMGAMQGLGMLGYNSEDKVYTYDGIDNTGHMEHSKGTTDGKTWSYTGEDKMGGKTIYGRYSITDLTPDSYTFKWEMSEDSKAWNAVMEGKATRAAKPAEAAKK
jgi:hypothetical protein